MSLRINHNIAAANGHRNMVKNNMELSKSLEKLSSGLRINRAADDAAGLIISEQMRAQITGLGQAISNSETAVSMVQTAEGALDEMNTLLNKARSLALHAANEGANDQSQLAADQSELDNIIESVNRIAENTQFGTKKLLDGSLSTVRSNHESVGAVQFGTFYYNGLADKTIARGYHGLEITQVGTKATLSIANIADTGVISGSTIDAMAASDKFLKTFTVSVMGAQVTVNSGSTKQNLFDQLKGLGKSLGFNVFTSGTAVNQLSGNIVLEATKYGGEISFNFAYVGGHTGAASISGTYTSGEDFQATVYFNTGVVGAVANSGGGQTVDLTGGDGLTLKSLSGFRVQLTQFLNTGYYATAIDGVSAGATFQIGANVGQKATVELSSMRASELGNGVSGEYASLANLKGTALLAGGADEALKVIDAAIDTVTVTRGRLGAFQANTLESGLNSLRTTHENLTAAESTIRDVDFAEESAVFTKNNILIQASTAMLAQANQLPQNVLRLLQ